MYGKIALIKKRIKKLLKKIIEEFRHFLVPYSCCFCRAIIYENAIFCKNCFFRIKPVAPFELKISNYIIPVCAVSCYDFPIKSLILAKNHDNFVASYHQGNLIVNNFGLILKRANIDYIVPIPLHWTRYVFRGFNQSEIIAKVIGKFLDRPVISALKRVKRTRLQASLKSLERQENLTRSFLVKNKSLKVLRGKNILLVDDLATTNSTLKTALKELVKISPGSLKVMVTCKTL